MHQYCLRVIEPFKYFRMLRHTHCLPINFKWVFSFSFAFSAKLQLTETQPIYRLPKYWVTVLEGAGNWFILRAPGINSTKNMCTLPEQQEWRIDSHNMDRLWTPFPKPPTAQYLSLPLELHHGETAFAHRNKTGTQCDLHVSSSLHSLHHSSFLTAEIKRKLWAIHTIAYKKKKTFCKTCWISKQALSCVFLTYHLFKNYSAVTFPSPQWTVLLPVRFSHVTFSNIASTKLQRQVSFCCRSPDQLKTLRKYSEKDVSILAWRSRKVKARRISSSAPPTCHFQAPTTLFLEPTDSAHYLQTLIPVLSAIASPGWKCSYHVCSFASPCSGHWWAREPPSVAPPHWHIDSWTCKERKVIENWVLRMHPLLYKKRFL